MPRPARLPEWEFTLDDKTIALDDWRANLRINFGYESFSGVVPLELLRRRTIGQGSVIIGNCRDEEHYYGRLTVSPGIEDGRAFLDAVGEGQRFADASGRFLRQTRDYGLWATAESDPHRLKTAIVGGQKFDVTAEDGKLSWSLKKDAAYGVGDRFPILLWAPGATISRVAFTINKNTDDNDFELRVVRGTGPSGALTVETQYALGAGNPDGTAVDYTLTGKTNDMIGLEVRCQNAVASLAAVRNFYLTNVRVNGPGPSADVYTTSQILTDLGKTLGFDTAGITSSGLNALPFDIQDGDWASEGADYLAELDDWYWAAYGLRLVYEPWTAMHTFLRKGGAKVRLRAVPLKSGAVVHYESMSGAPAQKKVMASPDPLVGKVTPPPLEHLDLTDPQPNDTLATTVATTLAARVSTSRYEGTVEVASFDVYPGHLVKIPDDPDASTIKHRVFEVEMTPEGSTLGIERPVSMARELGRAALEDARRPWKKPHKPKKRGRRRHD